MTATKHLILVVDDEGCVGELLRRLLTEEGYETRLFQDPQQVVFKQRGATPEVLITDYGMPGMNGVELMMRCRTAWPGIKTLMLSGSVIESDLRVSGVKPEVFLPKPCCPDEVLDAVKGLLPPGPKA